MGQGLAGSIGGLPLFLLYAVLGAALLSIYTYIYTGITSHDEIALIREGNTSAAAALGGSVVGFTIPLARSIQQASNVPDMLIWAGAAFVVQLLVYFVVRAMVGDLSQRIEEGNLAAGLTLCAFSIAGGMINAAAMTS